MKLFNKVAAIAVGVALATGVGAGIVLGSRNVIKAEAASSTTNFTLTSASQVSKEGVTVSFAKATGSTAPAWYNAGLRLYLNNTLTISCSQNITGVSFDWEKQGNKTFITGCTSDVGTYSHPSSAGTGTWSGSAKSITFTLGGSGQQLQLNTFSVTHESVTIVYATGISIDQSISSVDIASTTNLSATLTPASPTDSSIGWSSNNTDVLRVSTTGVVTAVGEGSATITANANGAQVANTVKDTITINSSVDNDYDYCDVINPTLAGVTAGTYTSWGDVSTTNASHSSAEYSGKTAYTAANDMQLNHDSGNGIIVSTSGGLAKKVVVVWNGNTAADRTLSIYGSNSALSLSGLSSPTESIVYGSSTEAILNEGSGYRYLGFKASSSGTVYVTSIIIYWDDSSVASLDLSGETSATIGETVVYTATRYNSSATIDWYVDDTKQNSGISVSGDTSTFSFTPSSAANYTIKAQLNGTEVAQTKTLSVSAVEKYTLVTDLTQLTVGNKVLVAATHSETTYVAKSYSSGNNNIKTETVTVTNNQITKTSAFTSLTLGAAKDGYTLYDEANYYWYASSTTSNYLKGQATAGNNAYFSISLSSGTFTIQATNNTDRGTMLYNYNNGTPMFSCYSSTTSGSNYETVKLYVLNTAPSANDKLMTFGKLFLHSADIPLVTEETGVEGTDCVSEGYYLTAKAALAGTWATVSSALQSDSTGLKLRYEAWARANNDAAPFDGNATIKTTLNTKPLASILNDNAPAAAIVVVVMSAVSVTAVGGFFLLKKKPF